MRTLLRKFEEIGTGLELLDYILGLLLGLYENMAGAHLRLRRDLGDLLVVSRLSLRLRNRVPDLLLIERVPERAKLVISEAFLEFLAGAKLVLCGGVRKKMRFHKIFEQDAPAGFNRESRDFRADLGFRKGDFGLRDVGTVHAGNRSGGMGELRAKCQRKHNRAIANGFQTHGWKLLKARH